jgi:hypothetical protein
MVVVVMMPVVVSMVVGIDCLPFAKVPLLVTLTQVEAPEYAVARRVHVVIVQVAGVPLIITRVI